MTHWFVIACMAALEVLVLRRLRFGWLMVALVFAGTLLSVDYMSYTPVHERNYDGPSHREYIRSIAEDLTLPSPLKCVACGHPPLYYALAALWWRGVHAGNWMPRDLALQWFSLILSFAFIVFALLMIRRFIQRPATMHLAAALVVFWPSTIINSVRVHNDALASLLMLAAMYYISEWDGRDRASDFYAALFASALALLTKATGYSVAAALLLFAVLRMRSTHFSRESIKLGSLALVVLVGCALLAVSLRHANDLSPCQSAFGRACDARGGPPPAFKMRNLLGFDIKEFVRGTDSLVQQSDHDYVANRLLKSSLFGVFPLGADFTSTRHAVVGVTIEVSLLAMLVFGLATLPFARPVAWPRVRAQVLTSALMLVALLAFRIRLPNPFHEDFRHIFPVLVPGCLLFAKLVELGGRRSRTLAVAGFTIGSVMMASSVAFFLRV